MISHYSPDKPAEITKKLGISLEFNDIWLNIVLTITSSAIIVVGLHFLKRELFNHWSVMRCLQSLTVGVILASAGVDAHTPYISLLLGCIGGGLFYLISKWIFYSALEDYCNIIAAHIFCGLFGSLVAPFLYTIGNCDVKIVMIHFCWQLICLLTIIGTTVAVTTPVLLILRCLGLLRNRAEYVNHLRSTAAQQQQGSPKYFFFFLLISGLNFINFWYIVTGHFGDGYLFWIRKLL